MSLLAMPLSGSTDGRPILVAANSDPGTIIHQALSGATYVDAVWLWAYNSNSTDETLVLEWGGNTDPDDLIPQVLGAGDTGAVLSAGWVLRNSLYVKAYSTTVDKVIVWGHAIRDSG